MADITDKTKRKIRLFSDEALAMILRNTPARSRRGPIIFDIYDDLRERDGGGDDEGDWGGCDATESDIY